MKVHRNAWFNAITPCKYLFCGLIVNLLHVQSFPWTVWPNNFHPHHHHMKSFPAWVNPTFNHHPPPFNMHHSGFPEQYHLLPLPYHQHELNSKNDFQNYEYLSSRPAPQVETSANYPSLNHSSTAFKVSNPIVRHVSTKNNKDRKSNLMLYQAPPSYDRIMDPPPSILITSRPFSVTTTTEKNSDFVAGEVKLATSPQVKFRPQQNIAADGNYGPNWKTGVTLKVSLRPGSWTKSKRPTISDQMKQFLPELKYYKKGLKAVDMNQIKNKVEKYVLVSKKEPDMVQEMATRPSITIMANDLLVYPQDSSQDSTKEVKLPDEWDNDSEEGQEFLHHDVPGIQKIDTITPSTDSLLTTTPDSIKSPPKSIEDIVAEVFATASPSIDEELEEKGSSQHEKGLSDLFDMIYGKNASNDDDSWLKVEPKENKRLNTTVQLITAPPDLLPLPELEKTITISNKDSNNVSKVSTVTLSSSEETTTPVSLEMANPDTTQNDHSEEMIIRCQGMWCHHSTPQTEPVALQSQQNWAKTGNEINPHDDVPQVDPLLSYLGLAWPQHDRQSKTIQSSQPTTTQVLDMENVTITTTHRVDVMTEQLTTSPPLPLPHFKDNDVGTSIPVHDRPKYKELKDFKHGENDINTSAPPVTQVSREHLEAMFNALGHGFGQVMSIIMPLAIPIHKENDLNESSGLNLDFNHFF